ncbi:hypothetical protein KIL84_015134 [Mauremys mutica]|uniref:NHR domain-containing protein n=1 Tax=Mauremys mutica TaxID=74926 RepID=A0A9D4BCI4_9SAUR|nr:hypothetical protein KIL84_015134 [Mauremys mutica]
MRALSPDVGRRALEAGGVGEPEPERLLFHANCGQKAAIIHDGRTALRPHPSRLGFPRAGVTAIRPEDLEFPNTMTDIDYDTWMLSGTAIMQDGNTMRNNYGCDLDSLTTGSRIGMMRTAKGDLHYFINGVDQGVACSGLPPAKEVYAVVDLYGQCVQVSITSATGPMDNSLSCGKNVAFQDNGCRAVRVAGYSHGIVFSMKELKADEVFEVKIEELDEKWSGSFHVGLTTLLPSEVPYAATGLPASLPELHSKATWLVAGSEVRRNGQLQKQNYGCSLERLGVGNRVGVKRCADDTMHILVDGEDMGPATTGVAKATLRPMHPQALHPNQTLLPSPQLPVQMQPASKSGLASPGSFPHGSTPQQPHTSGFPASGQPASRHSFIQPAPGQRFYHK